MNVRRTLKNITLVCSVHDEVCKNYTIILKVLALYLFLYGEVRNVIY